MTVHCPERTIVIHSQKLQVTVEIVSQCKTLHFALLCIDMSKLKKLPVNSLLICFPRTYLDLTFTRLEVLFS